MRTSAVLALLLCASLCWKGCEAAAAATIPARPPGECVTSNGSVNYFPSAFQMAGTSPQQNTTVNVTAAKDFTVAYYNNYKVVTNKKANETYVLYQCGVPKPTVGSPGVVPGAKIFEVPLINVAVADTVPLGFLAELNVTNRIQSVSPYSVSACGQKLLACNRTVPDTMVLKGAALQSALTSAGADAIIMTGPSNLTNSISFDASSDPGPLNRAEWLKFLGLFFNKDNMTSFDAINASYYKTKASAQPRGLSSAYVPVVAFIQKFSYGGNNSYQISFAPYKMQYVADAGGMMHNKSAVLEIPGAVAVDNNTVSFQWGPGQPFPNQSAAAQAFDALLQTVDVVIDETYAPNPTNYTYTTFLKNFNLTNGAYPFIDNNDVYREDKSAGPAPDYGLDWFETGVVRPDLVLQDFVSILSGGNVTTGSAGSALAPATANGNAAGNAARRWLRNIAKAEPVSILLSTQCPAATACESVPLTPLCAFVKMCADGAAVEQKANNGTCVYAACA